VLGGDFRKPFKYNFINNQMKRFTETPSLFWIPLVIGILLLFAGIFCFLYFRAKPLIVEEYLFNYEKGVELGTWRYVLPVSVMNLENHPIDRFLLNLENYPEIFNYIPSIRVANENWVFLPYDVRENAKAIAVLDNLTENENKIYYILWDNPIARDNQIYIAIGGETVQLTYYDAVYYTRDVQYYYSWGKWWIQCRWGAEIDWNLPKSPYEITIQWGYYGGGWGVMEGKLENGDWILIASAPYYQYVEQLYYNEGDRYIQKFTTPEIIGLRLRGHQLVVIEPIYVQSLVSPYKLLLSFGLKTVSSFKLEWDNDSIDVLENQTGILTGRIVSLNCKGKVGVMIPKWGKLENMLSFEPMVVDIEPNQEIPFTLRIENTTGKIGGYYLPIILYDNRMVDVSIININITSPVVSVSQVVLPENAQAMLDWMEQTLVPVMENYFNDSQLKNIRLEFKFNYAGHEYHFKVHMDRRKDGRIVVWIKEEEWGVKPIKERFYFIPSQ
jgi:hypothetical protein